MGTPRDVLPVPQRGEATPDGGPERRIGSSIFVMTAVLVCDQQWHGGVIDEMSRDAAENGFHHPTATERSDHDEIRFNGAGKIQHDLRDR